VFHWKDVEDLESLHQNSKLLFHAWFKYRQILIYIDNIISELR